MTSGGARARSGPPPDPNALRRDRDRGEWVHLPATGREGEPPPWPLSRQKPREKVLWAAEWRRPQAVMWEKRGQELEVALYVRAVVVAEGSKATASDRTVVLRFLEDLGLSQAGLARNRWIIDAERAEVKQYRATGTETASARDRFKVVDGGA